MLEMLAPSLYHFSQKYGKTVYGIVSAYGKEPDGTQPAPWGIQESLVLLLDKMLS